MLITNTQTITFFIPRDMDSVLAFKDSHPDWKEVITPNTISYIKEYTTVIKEETK